MKPNQFDFGTKRMFVSGDHHRTIDRLLRPRKFHFKFNTKYSKQAISTIQFCVIQFFIVWQLLTIFIPISFITPISAFNLDTSVPIYKLGPENSYFGYSVAEHVIVDKSASQIESVLLVGAPKARINGIHPGALYKCNLNSRPEDCSILFVDPSNFTNFDENPGKNDQWLGVTVRSQGKGGYVMVCAHRYVFRGEEGKFRWGNGICYSLTQYLDYSRTYEPCLNRLVDSAHEQFGVCQAGTSGEISKNSEILIGSPGPYTWRGTVFLNNIRHSIKDDKTWYMGPVIEDESPVSKYSYLGMSVSSGDFLGNSRSLIASGAPRSNGTGQVIFYSKTSGNSLFDLRGILQGEQFASSFGYSMVSLDCDGDGQSDLAVGAPFFYSRTEGGAVYVYLNKNLRSGHFKTFQKLTGKLESRFGFSLANLSDLNKDGFEDLAVGAPYERNGVVYIYLGGQSGLKTEPSQIIDASILSNPLDTFKTFGYSLSGNLDLDQNSYPDLLIGAYESDAVVLLRSRPIIKIKTSVRGNMSQIDPNSIGCYDDPSSKMPCLSVQSCFRLQDISSSLKLVSKFSLRYRIEAETFTGRKYYRAVFKQKDNEKPNIIEKTVALDHGYNYEYCFKEVIYLKNKQDIQNSIPFKLSFSLKQNVPVQREGGPLYNINDYPILDQEEAQRIFYIKFNKDCGSDDVCDSHLILKANFEKVKKKQGGNYTIEVTDDNIVLNINLLNKGEAAYDAFILIEHSSHLSYVARKIVTGQIDCSPENKTTVKCSLDNPFKKEEVDFQLRFDGHNIPDSEPSLFISMLVNTTSNNRSPYNKVQLNADIKRRAELELTGVTREKQVKFGGAILGESAMQREDQIGSKVEHTYVVKNYGPWRAKGFSVEVSWPYQIENLRENGKWILYIISKPTVIGQTGYCDIDPRYVNPRKFLQIQERKASRNQYFQEIEAIKRRQKRSNISTRKIIDRDGKTQKIATLSCDSGAKCLKFQCWISVLEPNKTAAISIQSRLWNATFIEDFFDYHHVSIFSSAFIVLNPLYNIIQSDKNDFSIIETLASPDALQKQPQVSFWLYLIAILLGFIILAFIIILLYKTGFFKRARNKDYNPVEQSDNGTDD